MFLAPRNKNARRTSVDVQGAVLCAESIRLDSAIDTDRAMPRFQPEGSRLVSSFDTGYAISERDEWPLA